MEFYAVIGYENTCNDGIFYGAFSTEDLAKECGNDCVKNGIISHYEIKIIGI